LLQKRLKTSLFPSKMMIVKQTPEDFKVEEVLELKLEPGPLFYYKMTKKNWNTLDLIREIAKRLNIRQKDIGFAGLKDRNAITSQFISLRKKIEFGIKDVNFEYIGTGKKDIYLGMLIGNKFNITIRDLEKEIEPITQMVNLFGEQRFSKNNVKIGKLLITKKFKEVCEELDLQVQENDFVGAFRRYGIHTLRIYVRAYQSYLWNKLALTSEKEELEVIGYLTEGKDYNNILKEEGVTQKDFLIRSFPEISAEGTTRIRVVKIKDFKKIVFEEDELNVGKKKQIISFSLPKGSYATVALQNFINGV
jgi:tRNA(Glu) U13 pseudouridine synthase TruD